MSITQRQAFAGEQAVRAIEEIADVEFTSAAESSEAKAPILPRISNKRKRESLSELPFKIEELGQLTDEKEHTDGTVLYLAYGSNLCRETFEGQRRIKPIAVVNVVVPELVLTFNLPGLPYNEPCMANTRYRDEKVTPVSEEGTDLEKAKLLSGQRRPKYHKDRWSKGLVGVVYEVTKKDYATIIATEGGGSSYQDVLVTCHPLEDTDTVPTDPQTSPLKAHTLYAPIGVEASSVGIIRRPDPSYAQPSARYLKLITDGATEHKLPEEYQKYLHDIRPYTITTTKQQLGKFLFIAVWLPPMLVLFFLMRIFKDKNGRAPKWLVDAGAIFFRSIWVNYDRFFKGAFGDGERTIGQGPDD